MKLKMAAEILVVALAATVIAGCEGAESVEDNKQSQTTEAEAKLRAWPSLEETERLVNDTVRGIAEAATALVPSLIWRPNRERSQYSCAYEYEDTGSRWVSTPHTVSDVPIPDGEWPRVLQAARDIAREAGITEVQVLSDMPGNRNVRLYGHNGNAITIGYLKASVISAETGCRLPAADLAQPPS
ncbi:hypothetical protein JGU71_09990 [Antrihabitans sp. YC3-6]|uniref:Lipoprotein n=1 Tax=Antrihabitans stalagmiti TaxID=2799499 RepID=A0A934NPZ0_9NOCA|nr:LppA family lipoprotein [Antrihabitans stalagmiti]MBJ8339218.1 hypothetical protein [Antrihabitans stalagmiti]